MRIFILVSLLLSVLGCTEGMPGANALTNPPKLEKSLFDESSVVGEYQQNEKPNMFLWPTDKLDENSGEFIPLTFEEKAHVRSQIVLYTETADFFSKQAEALELSLHQKHHGGIAALEKIFTSNKCYSFCDPDIDWMCDPEDDSILEVEDDAWIVGEDQSEKDQIFSCQGNQATRKKLKGQWDQEKEKYVTPLYNKAGEAGKSFLQTVGDRNNFRELAEFSFLYDKEQLELKIKYGDLDYSSVLGSEHLINNISLDRVNGFLMFDIEAIDLDDDNKPYGTITFDLELSATEAGLSISGDIRVKYTDGRAEKIGRFASAGKMSQN